MPEVEVAKFRITDAVEANRFFERVRQRVSDMFQEDLSGPGSKVNRENKTKSEPDVADKGGEVELKLAVPGFESRDLKVVVTEDHLIVHGMVVHQHEADEEDAYACDFGEKRLFRQYRLTTPIDVNHVVARVENGVLRITAHKKAAKAKALAAAAGAGGAPASALSAPGTQAEMMNRVLALVATYVPGGEVSENTTFDELDITSLDRLMLSLELEQRLGILIADSELVGLSTLGDLVETARNMMRDELPGWKVYP